MRRIFAVALWCAFSALIVPALGQDMTTVRDTIYMANGALAQGTIKIEFPYYCTAPGGKTISMTGFSVSVVAGVFSAKLQPNDTCNSTYYIATYDLRNGPQSNTQREYWIVPTSATPVSIDTIRQANTPAVPPYQIPLSQLTPGNAKGDLILFNGVSWGLFTKCADGYTIVGNTAHPSGLGWSCAALPTDSGGGDISITPVDDTTPVANGVTWQGKPLPNCPVGALGYNRSINAFVCNTIPIPVAPEDGYTAPFTSQDPLVIPQATHGLTACPAEVMIWTVSGSVLTRTEGYDTAGCDSSTIAVTVDFPAPASGIVHLMPTGGGSGGSGGTPGGSSSELQYRSGPSTFGAVPGWEFSTDRVDATAGKFVAPTITGTPACVAGQLAYKSDGSSGQRIYACEAGAWVLQGDGGAGGGGGITAGAPASSSATCSSGAARFDASYVYICVATNVWKRALMNSW